MAAPLRKCLIELSLSLRTPSHVQAVAALCRLQGCTANRSGQSQVLPAAKFNRIHTSSSLSLFRNTEFDEKLDLGVKMNSDRWDKYNTVVYPPTEKGLPDRPAEVVHSRFNMKYSPKKLWYIAAMIRGMSIDEAMKQLSFYRRKGSKMVLEILEEAQEIAVRDHNVEYKSNLWICDSFVGKGQVVKGLRKHMGPRHGLVRYKYVNYFVRLREGAPPKHYYPPPLTGNQKLEEYVQEQRARTIQGSL